MSILAIQKYQNEVQKIKDFGGSRKETAIRNAFYNLLNEYATQKGLMLIAELSMKSPLGNTISPDGTLKDSLRLDWGYWESKDEYDDIDEEIRKKFAKGYPKDNIIFEDGQTAVLIQNGSEVARVDMRDAASLDSVIKSFIGYERPEIVQFHKAIELFKSDIPNVVTALRELIERSAVENPAFNAKSEEFLQTCKQAINPYIVQNDINEMMIQHILTADIFNTIFDEPYFHRENNIAEQLEQLVQTFFTKQLRNELLAGINQYYGAINAAAAGIADHHEKQKFLKVVYENFYKAYNPKAADRLGVVYTPGEIVRFMIESADYLLHKHFGRLLADKNVEILDPATGTGTFVCDLIDYLPKDKLEYKYANEIHANEVAILPYYIANLNIEFTYKQRMGAYKEFQNLCFVDTLDNMGFNFAGKQEDIFGLSAENTERIKRQNERKISVIIGNPPYNANQMNENDNNKNRSYPAIDKRIKDTYIKQSTAQKTKVYDMYSRFYRWAMDRIGDEGIIAFISNRSFVNSRTFDGFRKTILDEFNECVIVDTRSDVRANPKISGTGHNVFGIQTGVAIMFLIKKKTKERCKIHYYTLTDEMRRNEKLEWFAENRINKIDFDNINPDKNNNWLNQTENDWEDMIPVASKETKLAKSKSEENAIFHLYTNGINTARDEWVYDLDDNNLKRKINHFISKYEKCLNNVEINDKNINKEIDYSIKWSDNLKSHLLLNKVISFNDKYIKEINYRPYFKVLYYSDKLLSDRLTENHFIMSGRTPDGFLDNLSNNFINLSGKSHSKLFIALGTSLISDFHFTGDSQCLPLYRYDESGNRIENITDWALEQFRGRYGEGGGREITKEDIFRYVYAALHSPAYRKKYESNLKREFPRIPFHEDFWKWSAWGERLLKLHIDFETAEPAPLALIESDAPCEAPRPKLKANKETGEIILDENTRLAGVPALAWEYKLGNRSALEWILDQYKEKKPKDPTITEKFNTYRFADYKEKVIDLLRRITTVSLETMEIIGEMGDE